MEDSTTTISSYVPADGKISGQWTYTHNNGQPDTKWSVDSNPESWCGGWKDDCRCQRPNPLWNVREVEKTAEIRDNFGFDRFKVYLYSSEEQIVLAENAANDEADANAEVVSRDNESKKKVGWRVTVTTLLPTDKWEPIFDSELFFALADASKCYADNVREYSLIAKVETQHYQDIKIYAEKIGYHRVEKCCGNCRWCHKQMSKKPDKMTVRNDKFMIDLKPTPPKLICSNYKLFAKRITDVKAPDFDDLRIQPEIDPGCVCDHFEKKLAPNDPAFQNHCYDQYGEDLLTQPSKTESILDHTF